MLVGAANRKSQREGMMKNLIQRFIREEEGQDLIEYALLAALIAVALIATLKTVAGNVTNIFTEVTGALAS